jgi:tetratricopeptide (TPR) repeat protein
VRLAVLGFAERGGAGPEGLGEALAQAVRDGLRQVRAVRLVASGPLEEAAGTLSLPLATPLTDADALRLGTALGLGALVTGSYRVEEEALRLQLRLAIPGPTARIASGEELSGSLAGFAALSARATRELLGRLPIALSEHDERRLRAIAAEPTGSPEAYALYGRGVWQQGLGTKEGHEEAVKLFTGATEADPNFALPRLALADSLRATGVPSERWRGSQEVRKAIQLKPDLAEAHRRLAEFLAASPRRPYDLAIQAFQKTVELSPDWAEAWVGLGDIRQAKGQFDEAVADYKRALLLEPNNARVHFGMGKIYYNEKQDYHQAVAEYQRAIALDPALLEAHLALGEAYEEKGLYQESIARYAHVLSLEAKHPGATYGLALAYEKVDTAKAMTQWERYIELAETLPSEKEWLDIARKHLAKLKRGEK